LNPFDPKVAGGPRGLFKSSDIEVPRGAGVSNSGVLLLREAFDGQRPPEGLVPWLEAHLAPDFQATFAGGKIVQSKAEFIAGTIDLLKSFPDFAYTRDGEIKYNNSPNVVVWTAVVKGTHSGAPFSPLPGVKAVAPASVACQNDAEKVTATFAPGTGLKVIKSLVAEPIPGGRGFSGPFGLYLQAGGSAADLP